MIGLLIGAAGVGLMVASGIVPIKASSRHWAVTHALLDFAKRRSVATHAMWIAEPPLAQPGLVELGAVHYDNGCRSCHGSPGEPPPRIPAGMTPHPPDLQRQVGRWRARELFYIVTHGIKFTGMPAWPASGRDDEVWAVVAFLQQLPHLDRREYERLTRRSTPLDASPIERIAADRCAGCHGEKGQGLAGTAAPRLAGQRRDYLRRALDAYASGTRYSGFMMPVAAAVDAGTRARLAEFYADLGPPMADHASDAVWSTDVTSVGDPRREVPACSECHGPAAGERHPDYPLLSGQSPDYIRTQIDLFRTGRRGGSSHAPIMHDVASRLTDAHVTEAVRRYGRAAADGDE